MELGEFSDNQLMLLYAHGRREAFDVLFHRHAALVHRLAVRMVGGAADAEEVLQEVFLRLARAAETWQPRAQLTTWLYRVAVNRCLTHRERRGRGRVVLLPGLEVAAPGDDHPYQAARDRELAGRVRARVAELPDALCAAFTLCALEGRSTAEAAEILEVPAGTVKTHVHRARLLLRRRLARELGPGAGEEGSVSR